MPTDARSILPTNIRRLQSGVQPAYAMLADLQLDVFTALDAGPATAAALATRRMGLRESKLAPLLYALALTGLLEIEGDCFSNSPEAAEFPVKGKPRSMAEGDTDRRVIASAWTTWLGGNDARTVVSAAGGL